MVWGSEGCKFSSSNDVFCFLGEGGCGAHGPLHSEFRVGVAVGVFLIEPSQQR